MRTQATIDGRNSTRFVPGMLLAAALALVSPRSAEAAEICVANDAQLATALAQAESSALDIEIVRGSYDLGYTEWHTVVRGYVVSGTRLLGGYAPGCTSRDIDAGNTIIDDSRADAENGATLTGSLTLEGLTWNSPNGLQLNADTDNYAPDFPPNANIVLRRDVFVGAPGGGIKITWGQDEDAAGTVRLVDTLVAASTETTCSLWVEVTRGSPTVQLVNNTFVDNSGTLDGRGSGVCVTNGYLDDDGNGSLFATNNIFHGNEDNDLYSDAVASLVDNVIGPHDTPFAIEIGTLSGNPHLDSDYRPIESPPSPVINSGSNSAPGGLPHTDLPGRDRVVGTAPDRGAYESSINDAFLQSVTNANDSGAGSLRSALTGALAHGSGLITFDLGTGCGPHVITLSSPLPALTATMIVNGYSQTGSSANDLEMGDDANVCVILEAGNGTVTTGLQVPGNAADNVTLSVEGIAFSNFSDAAVDLQAGSGHFLGGNHFGGSVGGHALQPNGVDIRLGVAAHDAMIGSDDDADRNIVGDATGSGILLQGGGTPPLAIGTYNNQIVNNCIGVGWNLATNDYTNRGNGTRGLHILGHDNTISGNIIGDNVQAGILVSNYGGANNIIDGNFIGYSGRSPVGNGNAGIHFTGDIGDAPAGNIVRFNTIAYNGDEGVWVEIGQRNKIRRNTIFNNGMLGIDLAAEGVNPNDDDGGIQQNDYANRGLNFPVLTRAAGGYETGLAEGSLTTTGGNYTLDFYASHVCDGAGNGEGQTWIHAGTVAVTVPQGTDEGTVDFAIRLAADDGRLALFRTLSDGVAITATATDSLGNTSEFSACVSYANDTIFEGGFD
jgi:parallel beta-helix repeat protein